MSKSYYPPTNDGRANFWANIKSHIGVFAGLGFTLAEVDSVEADADWGVYVYRTIREAYDEFHKSVIAYCNDVADLPDSTPLPAKPVVPAFPADPGSTILAGLEARREKWVKQVKGSATYTSVIGAELGLEASATIFDEAAYQPALTNVSSPSAHTLSAKFRKANGNIDGINLYGRKEGTMPWLSLGRFTATPLSALVPMAVGAPHESWEFLARAVKKDVEIGVPSDVVQQIVRA